MLSFIAASAIQGAFLTLALAFVVARCYVRLLIQRQRMKISDYMLIIGWTAPLLKLVCILLAFDWRPVAVDDGEPEAVLKAAFISTLLFEVGLYLPKASLLAFYWKLIPEFYLAIRRGLYLIIIFVSAAALITTCLDLFFCLPISSNWDPDPNACSVYNSWATFGTNWALNITTDLAVFILPFFLVPHLKLEVRQKLGVIAIFSVGALTILFSIARFAYFTQVTADVDTSAILCTCEMCTAIIVVSMPILKPLVRRKQSTDISQSKINIVRKPLGQGDNTTQTLVVHNY